MCCRLLFNTERTIRQSEVYVLDLLIQIFPHFEILFSILQFFPFQEPTQNESIVCGRRFPKSSNVPSCVSFRNFQNQTPVTTFPGESFNAAAFQVHSFIFHLQDNKCFPFAIHLKMKNSPSIVSVTFTDSMAIRSVSSDVVERSDFGGGDA